MTPGFISVFKCRYGDNVAFYSKSHPSPTTAPSVAIVVSVGSMGIIDLFTFNRYNEWSGGRPFSTPSAVHPADNKDLTSQQLRDSGTWVPIDFYNDWAEVCSKVDKNGKQQLISFEKYLPQWMDANPDKVNWPESRPRPTTTIAAPPAATDKAATEATRAKL